MKLPTTTGQLSTLVGPEFLEGAGGGGGSRTPTRTPDSLLSQDYVEMVLGICEGPIQGLTGGPANGHPLESFFLGETPIENASGAANFNDFQVTQFVGNEGDPPINRVLGGDAANLSVNVSLAQNTPVIRTTPSIYRKTTDGTGIMRLEIRLLFQQLVRTDDNGDYEHTANFRISYKASDSATWIDYQGEASSSVTGKTTTGYVKDFLIDVTPLTSADYDVRVIKLSPDNGTQEIVEMTWESLQMVTLERPKFPGLAALHIYGRVSDQFSSLPDMSGVFDGMIIEVPTNYNPLTRTYDESGGPWNGTTKLAYSNNPAWILWYLITSPEHGLARYYSNVAANRYEFYAAAKWCDEQVPSGVEGITQPRFTFNELIDSKRLGLETLFYIAGAFNSTIYDRGDGVIRLRTDRYVTPKVIFTPENVENGEFNYSQTDIANRYNDVTVRFINPDLGWEEDQRAASIDASEWQEKNGIIPFDFIAVGCTNAHEAVRRANDRLLTANTEVTSVSFATARTGVLVELFETIWIADPNSGWSTGGRIKSHANGVIQLRDPIFVPGPITPVTIKVQGLTDVHTLTVIPPATGAVYSLIITAGSLPTPLIDRAVFTVEDTSAFGLAKPFRVLDIKESPDGNSFQFSAIEVNVNKYPDSASGTLSDPIQYDPGTPGEPKLPNELLIEEASPLISTDGSVVYRLRASWVRPFNAFTEYYELDYSETGSGSWTTLTVYGEEVYAQPLRQGTTYDFRLFAVSPLGRRSQRSLRVNGVSVSQKIANLQNVIGFTVVMTNQGWEARWSLPTEIPDHDGVDIRLGTTAQAWGVLTTRYRAYAVTQMLPWQLTGTTRVQIKYNDTSGNESALAQVFDILVAAPIAPAVQSVRVFGGSVEVQFSDCTATQPLRRVLFKLGTLEQDWSTAADAGSAGADQRSHTIVFESSGLKKILLRGEDVAGNLGPVTSSNVNLDISSDLREQLGPINTADIADGAITATQIANNIEPVTIIPVGQPLPTTRVTSFILHNDGRLYRWDVVSGAYRNISQLAEMAGQLTSEQIEDLNASQIVGQLVSSQLQDGSITMSKLFAGLEPPVTVTSLPSTRISSTVFFNNRLHYWNGTSYTTQLPASDVTGVLTSSQIQSIQATQITGQIVAAQIAAASIDATRIAAGLELVANSAAANLPTTFIGNLLRWNSQLYRWNGSAYTASVPATNIQGQITSAQIASIATTQLTGQIVAAQIAAGAVSSTNIAAGLELVANSSAGSLPTTFLGNLLRWNSRLYRWNGSSYVSSVEATEITGQLTSAQIASISTAQLTGQIVSGQLASASIDATKIVSGLDFVGVVTGSLPTVKTREVISFQGKLYRWDGTAYVATVPTSDLIGNLEASRISGQVSAAQIASIAASQVTGQMVAAQIASVASTSVTGQLTSAQIASISTAQLTGQIVSSQISTASIDATKFVPGVEPIAQVTGVLPTSRLTSTIFRTNDGKLYRWDGAAYVASVPAADLTGQVIASQINAAIGGGNLVYNSKMLVRQVGATPVPKGFTIYNNASTPVTYLDSTGPFGFRTFAFRMGAGSITNIGLHTNNTFGGMGINWLPNTTYVISFYVRAVNFTGSPRMFLQWNTFPVSTNELRNPTLTSEFQRYIFRITWGGTVEEMGRLYLDAGVFGGIVQNTELHFSGVQIEIGELATAFAPRPDEILEGSITSTEVADNAITTPKIIAGAIVAGKIAAGAVSATELTSNSVTSEKIVAGAVTAVSLASNAVTADKIQAGAITAGKLAVNSIVASNITAGAITAEKILITSQGNALNEDPYCRDVTAWNNVTVVSDSTSPVGGSALEVGVQTLIISRKPIPHDVTMDYRVTMFVRQSSGTGRMYGTIVFYDAANNVISGVASGSGWPAVGSFHYFGLVDQQPSSSWQEIEVNFGPGSTVKPPPLARSFQVGALCNYPPTTGTSVQRLTSIRVVQRAGGSLIVDGSITATKIAANAVTAVSIQAGAITTAAIAAGAVVAGSIASNAITADKVQAEAIVAGKLAANSVVANNILAGSITADKLAVNSVTAGVIAAGAITTAAIAAGAITTTQLAANSVTATQILAGTITAAQIAADTITAAQIATGAITATELAAGSVTAEKLVVTSMGDSILLNPSFEEGSSADTTLPSGWRRAQVWGGTAATVFRSNAAGNSRSGEWGIVLNPGAANSADIFSQNFPVSAGERYYVSFWARSSGTNAGTSPGLYARFRGGATSTSINLELYDLAIENSSVPTTWTKFQGQVLIPAGWQWAAFLILNWQSNTGHTLHIDDVEIRKVVISASIADGAVVADKLAANSVTATKIAANAVTAASILAGSITGDRIAANTINGDRIQAGTISADRLIANSITAAQIATGAITADELAAGAVTTSSMVAGTIHGDRISAGTLSADRLLANSITAGQIAASTITGFNIAGNTITGSNIVANSVAADRIVSGSITATQIAANTITAAQIAADTITAAQIATGAITAAEIAVGTISVNRLLFTPASGGYNPDPRFSDESAWSLEPGGWVYNDDAAMGGKCVLLWSSFYSGAARRHVQSIVYNGAPSGRKVRLRARGYNASTTQQVAVVCNFYTAAGVFLSGINFLIPTGGSSTAVQSYSAIGDVPATASKYQLFVHSQAGGETAAWNGHARVSDIQLELAVTSELVVDGSIVTSHMIANSIAGDRIAANSLTADKIVAGSITTDRLVAGGINGSVITAGTLNGDRVIAGSLNADRIVAGSITAARIASEAITTAKLFISSSNYLNTDPFFQDTSAWVSEAAAPIFATVTDAPTGNTVVRSPTGLYSVVSSARLFPIDRSKNYRFRFWARSVGSPGIFYGCLRQYVNPATPGPVNGGRSPYKPSGVTVPTAWTEYSAIYGPADWQAGATMVRLDWLLNYTAGSGFHEICNARLEEMVSAELVVDGSITTDKLAANSVNAGKIIAGSITGDKIAANTITTSKLVLVPQSLNPDPTFRDLAFWGVFSTTGAWELYGAGGWYTEEATTADGGMPRHIVLWSGNTVPPGTARRHVYSSFINFAGEGQSVRFRARAANLSNQAVHVELQCYAADQSSLLGAVALSWAASTGAAQSRSSLVVIPARTEFIRFVVYNQGGTTFSSYARVSEILLDIASSSELIVDGAVIASKIQADAVTAGKIAAGAINAREIAAGAILASRLTLVNLNSVHPDSMVYDPAFWAGDGVSTWPSYMAPAENFDGSWPATRVLRFSASGGTRDHFTPYFPVELGATYRAKVHVYMESTFTGTFGLWVHLPFQAWFELNVPRSGTVVGLPAVDVPRNAWNTYVSSFTVAAATGGATNRGQIQYRFGVNCTAGAVFVAIQLVRMSDAELIVDGSITTNKMVANSIQGDRIASNSLSAEKIVAGSITADKLSIGVGPHIPTTMLRNADFQEFSGSNSGPNCFPGWVVENTAGVVGIEYGRNYASGTYWNTGRGGAWFFDTEAGGGGEWGLSQTVSVLAGVQYELHCKGSAHRCNVRFVGYWKNASNQGVGTPFSIQLTVPNGAVVGEGGRITSNLLWGLVTAPTGATSVQLYLTKFKTQSGQANSFAFFHEVFMAPASPGASASNPTAFKLPGMVQIHGGGITAETIEATSIKAGSINTDRLVVGAVTVVAAGSGNLTSGSYSTETTVFSTTIDTGGFGLYVDCFGAAAASASCTVQFRLKINGVTVLTVTRSSFISDGSMIPIMNQPYFNGSPGSGTLTISVTAQVTFGSVTSSFASSAFCMSSKR